ncbi:xanthine dehydrogenase subunit D [Litchfieldia salsa]|uniref:Xanthine dehydrogenase D subunit n=1 Tax=Litchfieldia salsa TaxID=930152 RepID=A0A1H0TC88_9BACI|nr:xanthine dehydrogenase subunit D [Litchfieldia salsa]SDP51637.1 xanthine dehydrogenase D subunit [Litchfieldia salsa]
MELNREYAKERWHKRPDGVDKVTGKLKYLTDLSFPDMLYGKILRSNYAHAKIISINTEHAQKVPGVKAVVTAKDVPGLNGFGLIFPDQPVFCDEKILYEGDALAAVAAVSDEIAAQAIKLIEVVYEPLTVLDSPEKALSDEAEKLHQDGNILHRSSYTTTNHCEIQKAFDSCYKIIEETYYTPRQMHGYMETEGGVVVPNEDGTITVYAATQHGFKDRMQLSRVLNMDEEKIRVISSPIGGSFGGKDELNVQPYASILALVTNKPVKIHQKRKDSVVAGLKRHPMKITMKTGVLSDGKILAHQVRIVADTGAYASLGPAVLDFAVEHSTGPYMIEYVDVEGVSVYTNNGVSGEFRGFGGNQVTFALESQLDRIAEQLNMSQIDIRRLNIRNANDLGPLGQRIVPNNGALEVLEDISNSYLLKRNNSPSSQWKSKGTGIAITMHGGGLGFGRPDPSGGRLSLNREGKIEIAFGFEEVGQGLLSSIEIMLTEQLGCEKEDISIVIGDTGLVPPSGSSTASRATNMAWQGIKRMKDPWEKEILNGAAKILSVKPEDLTIGPKGIWNKLNTELIEPIITYKKLGELLNELPIINSRYDFPTTPDPVVGGHYLYSFGAVAVEVEVDMITGKIKVVELEHTIAAGPIVNPMGYLGQIEGGGIMALGFTLMEDALMEEGKYVTRNFDTYIMPTIKDIPLNTKVNAIETLMEGDDLGPRGVGEIGTVALAPAIVAAIHDATGYWATKLPVSPEEILSSINPIKAFQLFSDVEGVGISGN